MILCDRISELKIRNFSELIRMSFLSIDCICNDGLLCMWMVEKGGEKLNLFLVVKFSKLMGIIIRDYKTNLFQKKKKIAKTNFPLI